MFIGYWNTSIFVLCGIVQVAIDVSKYSKHGKCSNIYVFISPQLRSVPLFRNQNRLTVFLGTRLPTYYLWAWRSVSHNKPPKSNEDTVENKNSTNDLTLLRLFLSCLVLTVIYVSSGMI